MIKLTGISKVFGTSLATVHALANINLIVKKGEALAVVGASGSGKTTLLDVLGTLTRPTNGQYFLSDINVSSFSDANLAYLRSQTFGFVFQSFNLLADWTAYKNIALPFKYFKKKEGNIRQRVEDALESVQMIHKQNRKIKELSGGEQQRIAIARAIVSEPDVILADEPTGNLDSKTGAAIISLLFELWHKNHTLIVVTHDLSLAEQFPRTVQMVDGKIIYDGPTESDLNIYSQKEIIP